MGHILMSEKERHRKAYMEMVNKHKLSLVKASEYLNISYRQAKRIYRNYRLQGDIGLVHKSRGRRSGRSHPQRLAIIARYKERYWDFGPTLAAEKLAEDDQLFVSCETLRRWLLAEKLWKRTRKRRVHKRRREPKEQFGEMLQLDGSFHDWFENGGQECLINFVDDATSLTQSRLESGETTAGIFRLMWQWIEKYGVPLSFYVDLKSVYISPKKDGFSQVQKACEKLGIRIIKAYSAQAKGRVERHHRIYQDRLIKELRLERIKTIEQANQFLWQQGYLDKLNAKFAKPARVSGCAHRPFKGDLNQFLCWEYQRELQSDWTLSFKGRCYEIQKKYGLCIKPKAQVTVRRHLDDSISIWHQQCRLTFKQLEQRPKKVKSSSATSPETVSITRRISGLQGKQKSPWNQFNPNWLKTDKLKLQPCGKQGSDRPC